LHSGDQLRLHTEVIPGESAIYTENGTLFKLAHVSCTLPQVFEDAKVGEPIYFDDGKIEGIIQEISPLEMIISITHAKDKGSKLKADKGINLPKSNLHVSGLTEKDREDIKFVAQHADAVNFSFVNSKEDILDRRAPSRESPERSRSSRPEVPEGECRQPSPACPSLCRWACI